MLNLVPPLLVANWKANLSPGEEVALAAAIAVDATSRALKAGSLMIAPSHLGLVPVASLLRREHAALNVKIAAQDCSDRTSGAHTGELPATHLVGVADAVILGHSERRQRGETGALIGLKVARCVAAGLTPIVCVGDTALEATVNQRSSEVLGQWREVVASAARSGCSEAALSGAGVIVAYEPVWGIGSDRAAEPELVRAIASALRGASGDQLRVLYGGSVDAQLAERFFHGVAAERIDGLLIGGASLTSERLLGIAAALGLAE